MEIPFGVTTIDKDAFVYCDQLTVLTFLGDPDYSGTFPNSITQVYAYPGTRVYEQAVKQGIPVSEPK